MSFQLDYLFFPVGVQVASYSVNPVWLLDHFVIAAEAEVGAAQRAPGPWRLRASLLEDEAFVEGPLTMYRGWMGLRPFFNSWAQWWEGQVAFTKPWCRERHVEAARWTAELWRLWRGGLSPWLWGGNAGAGVRGHSANEVPSGYLFATAHRHQFQYGSRGPGY